MTDLTFACTECGRCCHDLRLTLSVDEAAAWLDDGGTVEILCDASPAVGFPDPTSAAARRQERSFVALSGELPILVDATLAASFEGPCPNLQPDMRCGIYPRRPKTCRIYPAELRSADTLDPTRKLCPPEAWSADQAPFVVDGLLRDRDIVAAISETRASGSADAQVKGAICAALGVDTAAFANEGFQIWRPDQSALRSVLAMICDGEPFPPRQPWTIVSNRRATRDMIIEAGAQAIATEARPWCEYLAFFPDE